jgi:hypothetical protein
LPSGRRQPEIGAGRSSSEGQAGGARVRDLREGRIFGERGSEGIEDLREERDLK